MKYIVTNMDKTVQKLTDKQGRLHWLSPGESLIMSNPPPISYSFKIEELLPEVEEALKFEKLKGEKKQLKKQEVKK